MYLVVIKTTITTLIYAIYIFCYYCNLAFIAITGNLIFRNGMIKACLGWHVDRMNVRKVLELFLLLQPRLSTLLRRHVQRGGPWGDRGVSAPQILLPMRRRSVGRPESLCRMLHDRLIRLFSGKTTIRLGSYVRPTSLRSIQVDNDSLTYKLVCPFVRICPSVP